MSLIKVIELDKTSQIVNLDKVYTITITTLRDRSVVTFHLSLKDSDEIKFYANKCLSEDEIYSRILSAATNVRILDLSE